MHSTKSTRSSCLACEAAPMGLTPHVVTYSSVHPGTKSYWSSVLERGHVTPRHSSARHWCISNDAVAPLLDTKKIKTQICPCVYILPPREKRLQLFITRGGGKFCNWSWESLHTQHHLPGLVSVMFAVGYWKGVVLSSRSRTTSPDSRLQDFLCHHWRCCRLAR